MRLLWRSIRFYEEFPIPAGRTELVRANYRGFLTLKDQEAWISNIYFKINKYDVPPNSEFSKIDDSLLL